MPEAGIPAVRYIHATARSRYTGGTVINATGQKPVYRRYGYQRYRPEAGIPDLFSNAYWHRNAQVIEIQTRQQLKNNYFHETQRIFMKNVAFGHLAANARVRCSDFFKLPVCCIFESTAAIFVWRALRNFVTDMANVENVEEMVGIREAEAVATESGRAVATESGGAVATESGWAATRRWRRLVTRRRRPVGNVYGRRGVRI